jgi:23S rRNA pseudouridine1911/1915/1917 synthase
VQGGDLLRVEWADPTPESSEAQSAETEAGLVRIVAGSANYMIFDKPSGLHSAHIRGSFAPSLEDLLQTWPDLPPGFRLLSRLDRETSGLVPGALSAEAEETFRLAERAGQVRKIYLGMAVGRIREPLLLRGRIRTDRRSGSLVLDEEDPDPVRHSAVFPLLHLPAALAGGEKGDEVTLARVEIRRGARHQIRAHLARAGHPLLGDIFYGARARELIEGGPQFFLHHTRIALPGLEAESPPPWLSRFAPDFAGIGAGNFLSR